MYAYPKAICILIISLFVSGFAVAEEPPKVTVSNYVRAETDFQMQSYINKFGSFGKFHHVREAYDVTSTTTIRPNRDTIYSWSVFDLTSPLSIELPDPGDRYQSLMIVSQDHSTSTVYGPKKIVLDKASVGTRYALLLVRTFLDPNNAIDIKAAHALQDAIQVKQRDIGEFKTPEWDRKEVEDMRNAIRILSPFAGDGSKLFGLKKDIDPIYHLLGAAAGWGGMPVKDAAYKGGYPEKNDGKTAHTMTIRDVPVDAFWSVTVYNDKGMFAVNEHNAYSFNSVTSKRNKDGSVTLRFGGNPAQENYLHIVPGWSYIARMYLPQKSILDGTWTFPAPVETK